MGKTAKKKMSTLQVLKKLEWSGKRREDFGHNDYSTVPCCPMCGAINWRGYMDCYAHMHRGHKSDCPLEQTIKKEESDVFQE